MVEEDLTNDGVYICSFCNERFQAFTEGGTTNFSPCCADRNFISKEEQSKSGD